MERKFSRIISGIMSVVMFVFSVVNIPGFAAVDTENAIEDILDITALSVTLGGEELTNETVIDSSKLDQELKILFEWELNVAGYEPPVTFKYDLSENLQNITISPSSLDVTDASYYVDGQTLYITLKDGYDGRSGKYTLSGELELQAGDLNSDNRVVIQAMDKIVTPTAPALVSGLWAYKSAGSFTYDEGTGKYYQHFDINIGNNSSTAAATDVYVTDTFLYDASGVFADGAMQNLTVGGVPASASSGDKISVGDIAAGGSVVISYDLEVSAEKALEGKDKSNKAVIEYNNGSDTETTETTGWANPSLPSVSKSGQYNESAKNITWTVTVYPNMLKNGEFTFSLSDRPDGTVITAAALAAAIGNGAQANGDGTVSVPSTAFTKDGDNYTLTYTTSVSDDFCGTIFGVHVNNHAEVTFTVDEEDYTYSTDNGVTIPGTSGEYLTKTAGTMDANGVMDWTVVLTVPNDASISEITFWDTAANQGVHKIDYTSFEFTLDGASADFTVTPKGDDNFNIDFGEYYPNDVEDIIGKTLVIKYKTTADTSKPNYDSLSYLNTSQVWIKNSEYKQVDRTATAVISPDLSVSKTGRTASYNDEKGVITWDIKITNTSGIVLVPGDTITIEDTIPADHHYIDNIWLTGVSLNGASNQPTISADINGQTVTFTITFSGNSVDAFNNGQQLSIWYSTAMDAEKYSEFVLESANGATLAVDNVATVNVGSVSAEVEGTVYLTADHSKLIDKKCPSQTPGNNYTFTATYTLNVNQEKLDIVPGSDTITVTDQLGYWMELSGVPSINPSAGASYTYDAETRTIVFTLKDNTAYNISYNVSGKQLPVDHEVDDSYLDDLFSNTVILSGEGNTSVSDSFMLDSETFKSEGTYTYQVILKGEKTWADTNYTAARPKKVEIKINYVKYNVLDQLVEEGQLIESVIVQPDGAGKWEYTVSGLLSMDKECNTYVYSIEEVTVDGYKVEYSTPDSTSSATTINLKNTFTAADKEYGSVRVNKVWDDDDDAEGKRPASITVKLTNVSTGEEKTAAIGNEGFALFEKLPLYTYSRDADDNLVRTPCVYKVSEVSVAGYTTTYSVSGEFKLIDTPVPNLTVETPKVVTITNTLEAEETTTEETTEPEETTTSEETTSSEETTTAPEETTTSEETTTAPEETTSSETTTSVPEETTSSETTTSVPEETTSSEATTSAPEETTSSETTTSVPEETTSSETTTSAPEETTSSEATTSAPEETTSSEATTSAPEETTTSEETTTTPKVTTTSEETTTTPKVTTTSEETTTTPKVTTTSEETTTTPKVTTTSEETTTTPKVTTSSEETTTTPKVTTTSEETTTTPKVTTTSEETTTTPRVTTSSEETTTTPKVTTSSSSQTTRPVSTTSGRPVVTTTTTTAAKTTTVEETTTTTSESEEVTTASEVDSTTVTEPDATTTTEYDTDTVTTLPADDDDMFSDSGDYDDNLEQDTGSSNNYEENPNTGVTVPFTMVAALAFGAYAALPRRKKNK
ncbi:MAG: Cna B-type domain-containing protein [Ruminiclostridium sp.]|nr:Cna B-type domain-containing protein [Ruminiclostridium sp.]